MGSFNRHPTQAGHAFDAIIDIGAAKPIQQRAVIDTIASEHRSAGAFPNANGPWCETGPTQDLKSLITEIHNIPFIDNPDHPGPFNK